jgi:murein DD-endopeptidase MepM/ murein hydrolase activator NlpD
MQIMITDSSLVRTRALHFRRWQVGLAALLLVTVLMMISGAVYHFIFLKAAREGWPVVGQLVKLIVRDEIAQQERLLRHNLDAMAQRVGEMQAKLVKLEALSERVTGLAGVKADELKTLPARARGGLGGPFVPMSRPTLDELNAAIDRLDERTDIGSDIFTLVESRLFEARLQALLVPSSAPVLGPIGSGFGFRIDPITGRPALHTGLDFPSDVGTPIHAAAGGMVLVSENHAAYGQLLEIDHGNSLVTRYAHASKLLVKTGMFVKRGQKIGEVGNSGRSTGPHLHFEVLLSGVQQNPARFLAGVPGNTPLIAGLTPPNTLRARPARAMRQPVASAATASPTLATPAAAEAPPAAPAQATPE